MGRPASAAAALGIVHDPRPPASLQDALDDVAAARQRDEIDGRLRRGEQAALPTGGEIPSGWRVAAEKKAADAAASRRAKRSRDVGAELELDLAAMHDDYRARELADIEPIPTPVTVLGRTAKDDRGRTCFRAAWAARVSVDFAGFLTDGRPVRIEAKASDGDALRLDRVHARQREALERCERAGGLALLIVRLGSVTWVVDAWRLRDFGPSASWNVDRLDVLGRRCQARRVKKDGVFRMGPDWLMEVNRG